MVNIIIPVFHSRETLPRALKSLENQTDRKFIVTIVVDGDGEKYEDITAATPLNTHLFYLDKNYAVPIKSTPSNIAEEFLAEVEGRL